MITDALWTDFDGDSKIDLIVVGEFMDYCHSRIQQVN